MLQNVPIQYPLDNPPPVSVRRRQSLILGEQGHTIRASVIALRDQVKDSRTRLELLSIHHLLPFAE